MRWPHIIKHQSNEIRQHRNFNKRSGGSSVSHKTRLLFLEDMKGHGVAKQAAGFDLIQPTPSCDLAKGGCLADGEARGNIEARDGMKARRAA